VRVVQGNAIDLSLFDFDLDLTFAVFFLNADKTVYGRYGTRSSQKDAQSDISLPGFKKALAGALDLHAAFPKVRASLRAKTPPPPRYSRPELYPSLRRFKPELDYKGRVAKSCMHCHMIGVARRETWRDSGKPLPDRVLYPWPNPSVIGLGMDPREMATVTSVSPSSPASRAGLRAGDELLSLGGQPLLSTADIQWVLHRSDDVASIPARIRRGGESRSVTLELERGWRRGDDISWRTTSWDLRRMVTGGMRLAELSDAGRRERGVAARKLALLVEHVGQYGEHRTAKNVGFRKGDVIVEWAGRSDRMRETEIFAIGMKERLPGEKVAVTVLRRGKRIDMKLPMR